MIQTPVQASLLWRLLWWVAFIIRPFFGRLHVDGREHVPLEGGFVLASNHTLGADYVVLGYASPRQIHYMAKAEAFRVHPWLTRLLYAVGTFPVERGSKDMAAVSDAVDLLHDGRILGMFPEGTRSRDGKLQRGKSGATRIAMLADVPVVPVVLINGDQIFKRMWDPRHHPDVYVRFGAPIHLDGDAGVQTDVRRNTDKIMRCMAALLPPELRGVYGEEAAGDSPGGESA